MKKEVLFSKLEQMMIPEELQKPDDELKHSDRCTKWKYCDNIRRNVTDVIGMPPIDRDFDDSDIACELPFVLDGICDSTETSALGMMRRLNRFVKTKPFTNSKRDMVYSLKRELVTTMMKYTDRLRYEEMHFKYENNGSDKPAYYVVIGYDNSDGEHVRIHQPLDYVKKFFTAEELEREKTDAVPFADADFTDDYEHTEQETLRYAKDLARLYLYTKAIHGHYRNKA